MEKLLFLSLLSAALHSSAALHAGPRLAAHPVSRSLAVSRGRPVFLADAVVESEEPADEPASTAGAVQRARAWLTKWWKFDKDSLKRMGFDAFFTYGFVSNVNAGVTIAAAWYTFTVTSGISPLAPDQWKRFLPVYIGIYATFGTLLRPFRLALAVGLTPTYGGFVKRVQSFLPFRKSNPRINRSLGILVVSLLGNTLVTCAVIYAGITLSALATGVPNFPPGWSFAGFKGAPA